MSSYPDDYDPDKETVKEYVDRHLAEAMKREADIWADSVLYGDNSGGELKGILDGDLETGNGGSELRDQQHAARPESPNGSDIEALGDH